VDHFIYAVCALVGPLDIHQESVRAALMVESY